MAKIILGKALGETWLEDYYDTDSLIVVSKSATRATFRDHDGARIVFTGKGIQFDKDGPVAGTVSGVKFLSADGDALITIIGGSYKATDAFKAYDKNESIVDLMTFLTAGKDRIVGSLIADDIIIGRNAGDDTIFGKGGEDYIRASAGNNIMDGGAAFDVLSYDQSYDEKATATKGIVLDATKGTVQNSWGGTDKIKNFEEYRGSHLKDTMTGSAKDEIFHGFGGKDVIDGGAGWDEARYNRDDRHDSTKGIVANLATGNVKDGFGSIDRVKNVEAVVGTAFADRFIGSKDDNTFRGLAGKDTYNGGAGSDTVNLVGETRDVQHGAHVDLRLASGQILDDGFGNKEIARNIENIGGTRAGDTIIVGNSDGSVDGRDGADILVAGAGENLFTGGDGTDTFTFLRVQDSLAGTIKRDFITDFVQGEDMIDLSKLGALEFVGSDGLTGGLSQLAYRFNTDGNTIVSADIGGDGNADLEFLLHGKIALKETDFILL